MTFETRPTIHKFPLPADHIPKEFTLSLPKNAEILSVGVDLVGTLCLWALVNKAEERSEDRRFVLLGTGHDASAVTNHLGDIGDNVQFVGTATWKEGEVIVHLFERWSVETAKSEAAALSIPLILYCPTCHTRHIDEGEWEKKPHHTHACQSCGMVWRPAVQNTVGVRFLEGFKNII